MSQKWKFTLKNMRNIQSWLNYGDQFLNLLFSAEKLALNFASLKNRELIIDFKVLAKKKYKNVKQYNTIPRVIVSQLLCCRSYPSQYIIHLKSNKRIQ